MSSQILTCVWYFSSLKQSALVELAVKMGREGFAPREKMSASQLNVLMRGVAAKVHGYIG